MAHLADAILAELDREAQATRRILERLPEDKLGWRPHPKSMTLGQLAMHLASAPAQGATMFEKDTLVLPAEYSESPPATSVKEIMSTLDDGLAAARHILESFDDERMAATWTVEREGKQLMALPRLAGVRAILLNHWYHHRGQMSVYLRLLDVPVPAIYGPSADEDPFKGEE